MSKVLINQVVGYVAPPAKPGEGVSLKKGFVMEVYTDGTAKLDITPRNDDGKAVDPENAPLGHHTAIATFNKDKETENTFHLLDDETAAPAADAGPRERKSFAPGANANV